jgi:hypothetical protein
MGLEASSDGVLFWQEIEKAGLRGRIVLQAQA